MANTNIAEALPESTADNSQTSETAAEPESKREQSTISFPYNDLDDAVDMARAVLHLGGTCETGQLAAHLQMTPTSGSFRLRLLATKSFGFVTYSQGRVSLTLLGSRVCDPQQERLARAEAFLNIPLYKQLYERFKNVVLPPNPGIESVMVTMGVIKKQADKARQVFQRSAAQANFFWSGQDRLVSPPIRATAAAPVADPATSVEAEREPEKQERKKGNGGGDGSDYHPFIAGLLKTLPAADSEWPMEARGKWLTAASTIFELIYKDSDSKGSLRIEIKRETK